MFRFVVGSLALFALASVAWGQESGDSKTLKEALARFQEAYNAHDVEAMTGSWADDVDLIAADGSIYEGRETIAGLYRQQFEDAPEIALATEVFRVRVLGNAAVVDGSASVSPTPQGPAESTRFTAVYSRTGANDAWRLVSIREAPLPAASTYEKLAPLGWLVGDWLDDSPEGGKVFTTIEWSEDGNELRRTSLASSGDGGRRVIESRIFWNPTTEKIESRTHDEDRIVCGVWSQEGDDWVVSTTQLDQEGNKATARLRMSPKGEGEMTIQSLEGEGNAEASPAHSVKRVQ